MVKTLQINGIGESPGPLCKKKAGLAQRQDEPVELIWGKYIYGTAHHHLESSMEGTANQAIPAIDPAPAPIVAGRPATPAGVPQAQKGETHQLNLRRDLQFEDPEYLAREA
jgi:hypothetical protein